MKTILVAAGTLLAVCACGDATGVDNTVVVTVPQAQEVFVDMANALLSAADQQSADTNANATAETVGCSSGHIDVSNMPNRATPSGTYSITMAFVTCAGSTMTLDGNIVYSGSATQTSSTAKFSGALKVTGAVAGTCVVSMTFTASGRVAAFSGTICGLDAHTALG